MNPMNRTTLSQRLKSYKHSPLSFFLLLCVLLATFLTVAILVILVG